MRNFTIAQLGTSIRIMVLMTIALGVIYPLVLTGGAQLLAGDRADGQFVRIDGEIVGSALLGQEFTGESYFHSRPSSVAYAGPLSSGSNLGPTNPDLITSVEEQVQVYRETNGLEAGVAVPVDAVTSSASGFDPHISPANAVLQTARVATARGLDVDEVAAIVDEHTTRRTFGILGDDAVNVLEVNVALDELTGTP